MEFQFDRFVKDTGCECATDALSCLRSVDLNTIQAANVLLPFPEAASDNPLPLWYFLPVIDGDLIPDHMYNLFEQGRFIHVPLLVGDDTDEGTIFAYNASTPADVSTFMKNNYPHLNPAQLQAINEAYPRMPPMPEHAAYFPSASAAYGESTFTCVGNQMAFSLSKYFSADKVWNYRYNVQDPTLLAEGQGTPHTIELSAIFGPGYAGNAMESYYTTNAALVPITMHYWISFVKALDPNPYRYPGAPVWEPWGRGTGQRLRLQTSETEMERVPRELTERCALWRAVANAMEF
jgi:acetylcholinesterase